MAPSMFDVPERGKEERVCARQTTEERRNMYTYGSMAAVSLTDTLLYGGALPGAAKAAAMPNGIAARATTSFLSFMS